MKVSEKIRKIRKEKKLTMVQLHNRLKEIFKDKALRYNTLYRIEKGLREARVSSLLQICTALGISLKELKEGTDEEVSTLVDIVSKRDKIAQYVYSPKAKSEILSGEKQPFLVLRLILEPDGKTNLEQDPAELGKFEKWIYGLRGKVTCIIANYKYVLKKDEALCFESTLPHYFENNTTKKAACLIIQNPKHL